MRDLIEWIVVLNKTKLQVASGICTKEEVEKIIIEITSKKTGIPAEEIELKHSFTNDLGID